MSDHSRSGVRATHALGIGVLVIPLATICALSLLPERLALSASPMARQLVLYIEERSRRAEAAETELAPSGFDEQVPDVVAQVDTPRAAAVPDVLVALPICTDAPLRTDETIPSLLRIAAPRLGRAPPCA